MRHYGLLKKHLPKYETQQKVIEAALENLDHSAKQKNCLSEDDEFWLEIGKIKASCALPRESLKILLESFNVDRYREHVAEKKPLEFIIEIYYQKPLSECSLVEILDALVKVYRVTKLVDTVEYADDGDHYTLKLIHDFGFNHSRMLRLQHEVLFKTYGIYASYIVSDRSLFIKIYKIDDMLTVRDSYSS